MNARLSPNQPDQWEVYAIVRRSNDAGLLVCGDDPGESEEPAPSQILLGAFIGVRHTITIAAARRRAGSKTVARIDLADHILRPDHVLQGVSGCGALCIEAAALVDAVI